MSPYFSLFIAHEAIHLSQFPRVENMFLQHGLLENKKTFFFVLAKWQDGNANMHPCKKYYSEKVTTFGNKTNGISLGICKKLQTT